MKSIEKKEKRKQETVCTLEYTYMGKFALVSQRGISKSNPTSEKSLLLPHPHFWGALYLFPTARLSLLISFSSHALTLPQHSLSHLFLHSRPIVPHGRIFYSLPSFSSQSSTSSRKRLNNSAKKKNDKETQHYLSLLRRAKDQKESASGCQACASSTHVIAFSHPILPLIGQSRIPRDPLSDRSKILFVGCAAGPTVLFSLPGQPEEERRQSHGCYASARSEAPVAPDIHHVQRGSRHRA